MRVIKLLLLSAATSLAATLSIDQRLASLESKIDALASVDAHDGEVAALGINAACDEGKPVMERTDDGFCGKCENADKGACTPLFMNKRNACYPCKGCDYWKKCEAKGTDVKLPSKPEEEEEKPSKPEEEEEEEKEEEEEETHCCMSCNKAPAWPFNNGLKCEAAEVARSAKFTASNVKLYKSWGCSKVDDKVEDLREGDVTKGTVCKELLFVAKTEFCDGKDWLLGEGKPCEPYQVKGMKARRKSV